MLHTFTSLFLGLFLFEWTPLLVNKYTIISSIIIVIAGPLSYKYRSWLYDRYCKATYKPRKGYFAGQEVILYEPPQNFALGGEYKASEGIVFGLSRMLLAKGAKVLKIDEFNNPCESAELSGGLKLEAPKNMIPNNVLHMTVFGHKRPTTPLTKDVYSPLYIEYCETFNYDLDRFSFHEKDPIFTEQFLKFRDIQSQLKGKEYYANMGVTTKEVTEVWVYELALTSLYIRDLSMRPDARKGCFHEVARFEFTQPEECPKKIKEALESILSRVPTYLLSVGGYIEATLTEKQINHISDLTRLPAQFEKFDVQVPEPEFTLTRAVELEA